MAQVYLRASLGLLHRSPADSVPKLRLRARDGKQGNHSPSPATPVFVQVVISARNKGFGVKHIWDENGHELGCLGCKTIEQVAMCVAFVVVEKAPICCEFVPKTKGYRVAILRSSKGYLILEPILNDELFGLVHLKTLLGCTDQRSQKSATAC